MVERLEIPLDHIVTVEHPGVVKHIDKAISSLGGHERLDEFLSSRRTGKDLYLFTRPEDRLRRPIAARQVQTSNLVIQVEVPRLTGRKRKRGSDGPFEASTKRPSQPAQSTAALLRSLKDNPDNYKVCVVGESKKHCKFLGLPDMQWSLATHHIAKGIKTAFPPIEDAFAPDGFHLLPGFLPSLTTPHRLTSLPLDPNRKGNSTDLEIAPPATFMTDDTPFDYQYAQAIYSRTLIDAKGNAVLSNQSRIPRSYGYMLDPRVDWIPSKPKPNLAPASSLLELERDILKQLEKLYEKQPIYTRRKLLNALPDNIGAPAFRNALQYVAYMFKAGPWKDCYIKLGVDPRKNPAYRIYQSIAVRLPKQKSIYKARQKAKESAYRERRSHVFDGKSVELDGNMWAVIDISEPLIKRLVHAAIPRSFCETRTDGWFQNCTLAKIRTILRHKIVDICEGRRSTNKIYNRILSLPETISVEQLDDAALRDNVTDLAESEMLLHFKSYIKQDAKLTQKAAEKASVREISRHFDSDGLSDEEHDSDIMESDEEGVDQAEGDKRDEEQEDTSDKADYLLP